MLCRHKLKYFFLIYLFFFIFCGVGGGRILVYVDWSAVLITAKLDRHFTSSIETMSRQNVSKFFDWTRSARNFLLFWLDFKKTKV